MTLFEMMQIAALVCQMHVNPAYGDSFRSVQREQQQCTVRIVECMRKSASYVGCLK